MSAGPALKKPSKFKGVGDLFKEINLVYDSGAFDILYNKALADKITPDYVLETYEIMGYTKDTRLIQFDLPIDFYDTLEKRLEWIVRSILNYLYMVQKNNQIIPVIHGWTLEELQISLEGVLFGEIDGLVHDYSANADIKEIAVGSYAATTTAKVRVGNQYVGVGSYSAKMVPQVSKKAKRTAGKTRLSAKIVYPRLAIALSLLKKFDITDILVLGAGGIGNMHLAFACGAIAVDGTSWKMVATRFFAIFIPGRGTRTLLEKMESRTYPKANEDDLKALRELHKQPDYPFADIPFETLCKIFATEKDSAAALTRMIHNVYVIKYEIENYSMEFANDPDGYFSYLEKRWHGNRHWTPRLKIMKEAISDEYIPQADLRSFLKMKPNDTRLFQKVVMDR